jgi:beta-phosphoglucomutase
MIEAVLFDLDGVLVDACDWHYDALNMALNSFGYSSISREDHEKTFNGLPTKVKLKLLGISSDIAEQINKQKQKHTLDIINKSANIMHEKIDLYHYLKSKNIKIGCVTNSIRETAIAMLKSTGQYEYMDLLVSNEDVINNKPHPDCYNFAIRNLNVAGEKVLCVEDSDKGIQSVLASIAGHLCVVKNTTDVNIHTISKHIEDIQNENTNTNGRRR